VTISDAVGGGFTSWSRQVASVAGSRTVRSPATLTAAVLSRGVWHRIEVYAMLPPASGGDGTVRVWVDGTLTINRADVPMSFGSQKGWVQLHHDAIWGGVGDTKQHDDYVWLDQTYISGP